MLLDSSLIHAAREHASKEYPRESCGVIISEGLRHCYIPCRNIVPDEDHFQAAPLDILRASQLGRMVAVVHSHPDYSSHPSPGDIQGCDAWGLPWFILGDDGIHELRPTGYHPPLLGRSFQHGTVDCFSLLRDYYREALGIALPDFKRPDEWWANGQNLYLEGYQEAGFEPVAAESLQPHDILLIQLKAPVPNHGAIYLGDGQILHHLPGRLSRRESHSSIWQRLTKLVVRHKDMLCPGISGHDDGDTAPRLTGGAVRGKA